MVCFTWPHLANWREIYNAAVLLQRALGIISPAQQCLCRPSLNIWGALVGMNGGTGFHHKAVKGEPAGGHFNSSVNIIRSRLCQLSKQYIADTLKGSDGCFLERPSGFLRTPLMVPTGLGHLPVLILSGVSKVTMRRKTTEGDTSVRERERENLTSDATTSLIGQWWQKCSKSETAASPFTEVVHLTMAFLCLQCHYVMSL